jgi:hypothetical protein
MRGGVVVSVTLMPGPVANRVPRPPDQPRLDLSRAAAGFFRKMPPRDSIHPRIANTQRPTRRFTSAAATIVSQIDESSCKADVKK